jgi:hypothetical protein
MFMSDSDGQSGWSTVSPAPIIILPKTEKDSTLKPEREMIGVERRRPFGVHLKFGRQWVNAPAMQ